MFQLIPSPQYYDQHVDITRTCHFAYSCVKGMFEAVQEARDLIRPWKGALHGNDIHEVGQYHPCTISVSSHTDMFNMS